MQKIILKRTLVIVIILLISSILSPLLTADNLSQKEVIINNENNILYTLLPTDDTWISESNPNANCGSNVHFNFRSFQNGWNWYDLIKFDLTQIPSNEEILYAKMYLYYYEWNDNNPSGDVLRLYRALEDWSEDYVTWNNQPSVSTQSSAQTIVPGSPGVWMSWDVTEDVIDFISGGLSNFGWMLKDDTYWGGANIPWGRFHSKEYSELRPYLEIETAGNNPPNKPNRPSGPAAGYVGNLLTFSTSTTDPDNDMVQYGWDWNGDNVVDEWSGFYASGTICYKNHMWDTPGIYNIKVKAKDSNGAFSSWSDVKSIEILIDNQPPHTPNNPEPSNHSIDVDINTDLSWSGGDPDVGDTVTYDVYFGSMLPLPKVASNITSTLYDPGTLANSLTYFWSIVAWDNHGASTVGPGWVFTTTKANNPPNKPSKPIGEINGTKGITYLYATNTIDPDEDQVYYLWDWGDGSYSKWSGPYDSGLLVNASHSWAEGSYNIRVKSKDIYDLESEWSDPLVVTMPKNKVINIPLLTADNLSDKDTLVSFTVYGKSDVINCEGMLSFDEAFFINDLFKKLQYEITYHPFSDETLDLKSSFVEFLDIKGLLPKDISNDEIIELLKPPYIHQLIQNKLLTYFLPSPKISSTKGTAFLCSVVSGGSGKTTPIVIGPRPRAIVLWSGGDVEEISVTTIGGIYSDKGFIAYGNQDGMLIGFEGVGLTYGTPYGTIYGLIGYAIYASVTAELIEFYPPNSKPEISNPNPSNNQKNIPTTLSELSFQINDDDNELMDYSVTTNPFIGSDSNNNVGNGIYSIPVTGLQYSTTYTWTVTVTDGKDTTTNIFSFTTVQEKPVVTNPNPIDGSTTSTDLSELSFTLTDAQGDKMDYTIETSPDIGSDSATDVGNGIYSIPINGLEENKWYYWYVNVTDGERWTREKFSFYTGGLGLVGYWSFDEGMGNTAYDASEYKNDAKLYGPTWTSDSTTGYALEFDGIKDYAKVNNDPSLNFHDTNKCTISLWFKSKGNLHLSYSECLISKATSAQNSGYTIQIRPNKTIIFEIYNGRTKEILYSKNSIKENTWCHVVAIWDGEQQYIYLNGVLDSMKNIEGFTISDDTKPLEFGNHYGDISSKKPFHGIIDEIHFYDRVINQNEIMYLYQKK